jgi:hypothetical protein
MCNGFDRMSHKTLDVDAGCPMLDDRRIECPMWAEFDVGRLMWDVRCGLWMAKMWDVRCGMIGELNVRCEMS